MYDLMWFQSLLLIGHKPRHVDAHNLANLAWHTSLTMSCFTARLVISKVEHFGAGSLRSSAVAVEFRPIAVASD